MVRDLITKKLKKDKVFDLWMDHIRKTEVAKNLSIDKNDSSYAYAIAYLIFPLLESIGLNLFQGDMKDYLLDADPRLSKSEVTMLTEIYRHGLIHGLHERKLIYNDGTEISWGTFTGSSSVEIPYNEGYHNDEHPGLNEPAEKFFTCERDGCKYYATLNLEILLRFIKYDLEKRRKNFAGKTIDFVIGRHMKEKYSDV